MKRLLVALMVASFLGATGAAMADDAMMSATPMATPGKMMMKKKKKKMKKHAMMTKGSMQATPAATPGM